MSVVLQVSDSHFGTEVAAVVAALRRFALELRPDLLVLSGDLTQRARSRQFAAARRFVDSLQVPALLALPGNHDIALFNLFERSFRPYAGYQRCFGAELMPQFESADLLVLGVNTTRPWRHKHGEVSAAQVEQVAERLGRARTDQLRVVVTHQPVHVLRAEDAVNRLRGADLAIRRWAEAGADLVLGGHIHLPYVRNIADSNPQLARALWAVQAGTAVSSRIRDGIPNSVNVLRYDPAQSASACQVERMDYDVAQDAFSCHSRQLLALAR